MAPSDLGDTVEIDVADEQDLTERSSLPGGPEGGGHLALGAEAVHADVDDHRAGLDMLGGDLRGRPTAATSTSAWRVTDARSGVRGGRR